MKNLNLICALLALAFTLAAADPTGRWTAEFQGPQGNTVRSVITLRAAGENLTGSVEGMHGQTPITDGKIEGSELTFAVIQHWQGVDFKTVYHGVMKRDVIHFTVTRQDRQGPAQIREFNAKRTS